MSHFKQMDAVYASITNNIISALEEGVGQWQQPWTDLIACAPFNAVTKHYYNGTNVLNLAIVQHKRGYSLPFWAGLKQWNKVGCKIEAGQGSEFILRPFIKEIKDDDDEVIDVRTFVSWYRVFNIHQVSDWEDNPALVDLADKHLTGGNSGVLDNLDKSSLRIPEVDDLIERLGVHLIKSNCASYRLGSNTILMPPIEAFLGKVEDPAEAITHYYSTLLHELTHWTGHPDRCNREQVSDMQTQAYAFEELVAELGSAFLCARFGLSSLISEDHLCYIQSWIRNLKEDNRSITRASSLATQAACFIEASAHSDTALLVKAA